MSAPPSPSDAAAPGPLPAPGHVHDHDPKDTLGQVLSAVCAVHCAATPLVVLLMPAAASVLGGAHPVLFVLVVGVALWAFVPAYRCHRDVAVVGLALAGVTLLGLAAFLFHQLPWLDTSLSLLGAAAMMGAHWRNRVRLRTAHQH